MTEGQLRTDGDTGGASRRPRARRWIAGGVAVIVIVIAIFALAQSGGGGGGGPLNAIAKAAEVTQREPGGRAVFHVDVTSPTSPEGVTEKGSIVFDEGGRTRGTIEIEGHKTGLEGKILAVSDGTKTYMTSDLFESLPEGKKWMEVDLTGAVTGPDGSAVSTKASPTEGLKVLEKVVGAKEVGKEDIEGEPTTRYSGTLPTGDEVFGAKFDVSRSRVDVWIDAQGRVRRMHLSYSAGLGEEGPTANTDMTFDYVEFGRVPAISIPPQSEVFDATDKVESAIQSAAE